MSVFYEKLCLAAGDGRVRRDEPMAMHTTFRVGGPAAFFAEPEGEDALARVIRLCREEDIPFYILGNGSNLLISDQGYRGVMIRIGDGFSDLARLEEGVSAPDCDVPVSIRAGAGLLLSRIASWAAKEGLAGLEFAAGIPGTLGGAVVMNAGDYGGEMKDVIRSVRTLGRDGRIQELSVKELRMGYRFSSVQERGDIVLGAVLGLRPGDRGDIQARMEDLAGRRREKQPLEYPSAGSAFKRPAGYFAGKLIEDAGLRGYRDGNAQVSEKHCGFVINRGGATAEEIRRLCGHVQKRVAECAGVHLETEIRMIGFEEGTCDAACNCDRDVRGGKDNGLKDA